MLLASSRRGSHMILYRQALSVSGPMHASRDPRDNSRTSTLAPAVKHPSLNSDLFSLLFLFSPAPELNLDSTTHAPIAALASVAPTTTTGTSPDYRSLSGEICTVPHLLHVPHEYEVPTMVADGKRQAHGSKTSGDFEFCGMPECNGRRHKMVSTTLPPG